MSPQHEESGLHWNFAPWRFVQTWLSGTSSGHRVAAVTAYLYPALFEQHLPLGAEQVFPQHVLSFAHTKLFPRVFSQHVPPGATQMSPQHEEPSPHTNGTP
mmetsp:Transcript_9819/g.20301  ORF Transcript_9819/g.20301 Transcript_9819/m.20301 type:complete len:101 (+) Transcript_9819:425-727(+)